MQKLKEKEQLDVIMEAEQDPNPPADDAAKTPVPTREDLYGMCLALQKQIKTLDDKVYVLTNQNASNT